LPSTNSGIVKYKKINHPITYDYKERPTSLYFPVTGPKSFRKTITWIKIKRDELLLYKDVPFVLSDITANVPTINRMITDQVGLKEPVLLELRFMSCVKYQAIKDGARTRGELFWNSKRKFYFISRDDWEKAQFESKLHALHCSDFRVKHLNIVHKTFFDKKRDTYFKNVD
jgi:hypothetical protein